MKLPRLNRAPLWIALAVILAVCLLHALRLDFLERLEALTYDMRVRHSLRVQTPATNLFTFVYLDEGTLKAVQDGSLGYRFGLYWPRQVYGRLLTELSAEGAEAVALDVLFGELRPDHPPVQMIGGALMESDEFFANQLRACTNSIIALTPQVIPPALFLTNAWARGDISTDKDPDGILRRVRAFRTYRIWHPVFRKLEADAEYGVDLSKASVTGGQLVLPRTTQEPIIIPLDKDGQFELADLVGKVPEGMAPKARPFTEERVWHMGVVLAAQHLGLRLDKAEVDLDQRRIRLTGESGETRTLPVDREGYFLINWALTPNDPRLTRVPMQTVLQRAKERLSTDPAQTNRIPDTVRGKLVVVGSAAVSGNDLVDRGATPFSPDTLLVGKHWNVANSIVLDEFVRRMPLQTEIALIVVLGAISAVVTWRLRAIPAFCVVILVSAGYVACATIAYVQTRYWIPIAMPVLGALGVMHVCLVTWRVVFEQADKRRVAGVLSTIVSPKIARELLKAEKLTLGGARREITVLFADVRGFTELTDTAQQQVEVFVRERALDATLAEAHRDEQARLALATVNLYLGAFADTIINHEGTLDKFIGDCVMAFWGAPASMPNHAVACVRAAIEAQRTIRKLNREREEANRQIEAENRKRVSSEQSPQPSLPLLQLGTGISTGMATVGLMGSEVQTVVRQGNYTVFGRDVNLASRLENLSGSGHIYISQATYYHIERDDPELAGKCVRLAPATVKGIREAVTIYDVRWD